MEWSTLLVLATPKQCVLLKTYMKPSNEYIYIYIYSFATRFRLKREMVLEEAGGLLHHVTGINWVYFGWQLGTVLNILVDHGGSW